MSIPKLKFPRNYIIEIVPASYQNHARRILIDGIDTSSLTAPNSPDNSRNQAGASGVVSPMVQLDPAMGNLSIGGSSTPLPVAVPSTPNFQAGATTPNTQASSSSANPSPGTSTPLPIEGATVPVVVDEPAEIDENNVVGKEHGF